MTTCPKKHTRPRCSARSTWSSWLCTCASVPLYSSLPRVKRSVCSRLPITRTTSNATAPPPSPPPSPSPSASALVSSSVCCDAERTVPRSVTTARGEASLITPRASTGLPPARASVLPVSAHSAAIARVVLPAPLLALSSSSSAAYPPSSSSVSTQRASSAPVSASTPASAPCTSAAASSAVAAAAPRAAAAAASRSECAPRRSKTPLPRRGYSTLVAKQPYPWEGGGGGAGGGEGEGEGWG